MNKEIELLNNKLAAQDKIINTQALEIARLKKEKQQAIKWIKEDYDGGYFECGENDIKELLELLGDKEIEEIPLFDGTLEQLNNLSILGEKENENIK